MRINELQQSNTVASGNVFAIDTINGTFKIDYDVLAAAIQQSMAPITAQSFDDLDAIIAQMGGNVPYTALVLSNTGAPKAGNNRWFVMGFANQPYTWAAQVTFAFRQQTMYYRDRANSSAWSSWRPVDDTYSTGTTYTFDNTAIGMAGYVSAGLTKMEFFLPLPESLANVNAISCTSFNGVIRGVSGYVNSVGTNTEWTTMSGITVSVAKAGDNMVRITFNSSSALTNLTNNTPLHAYGTITLSFT